MSRWIDPEEWTRLLTPEGCPICRDRWPSSAIAELEVSSVARGESHGPLPGSCAVFLRRHAVELHELAPDEAAAYVRDLQRVSRAVQAASGAVKINLEIHGNTIPHLHTHVFPRYPGDPFQGSPINPRLLAGSWTPPVEHAEVRRRVMAALGASPASSA
jgi:diadenosine tetraphosphate (Ap4A) HIT family hydrolase